MIDWRKITLPKNRGILLDVVVLVFNSALMILLTGVLREMRDRAKFDRTAKLGMLAFCLGVLFLQPVAGLLKRRRAHERNPSLGYSSTAFLLHPALYFLSKLIFLIAATGLVTDLFLNQAGTKPDDFGLPPGFFLPLFLGVPLLAGANTAVVYFYFWKPKRKAWFPFLEKPQTELVADIMLFFNMIAFQAFWGLLMLDLTHDLPSLLGRFFMFGFCAALIYLPPRLYYLAEDGDRTATWVMMLLANSPIILRMIISK